jgi:predicted ATPase
MKSGHLYIDNFRGFKKTFMPIKDVNFFVGENSTGKTSVLSLISLISSQEFWLNGEFRSKYIDFGFFGDIYGENYQDSQSVTTIAVLFDEHSKESLKAFMLKVGCSKDGRTQIKSLKLVSGDKEVRIACTDKGIKYLIKDIADIDAIKFPKWVDDLVEPNNRYKKVKRELDNFSLTSPYFLMHYVAQESNDTKIGIWAVPGIFREHTWLAPIRVKPQKTYDNNTYDFSPEGAHTPYVLRQLIGSRSTKKSENKVLNAIKKFGQASGLFDDIEIKEFDNTSNSPFSLDIVLFKDKHHITDVGYGVSQVLPIVIEILRYSGEQWFAIQQPEVHLHPKAQASLGELIYESAKNDQKRFFIETHSDFIVNRFRQKMHEASFKEGTSVNAQAVFFEKHREGNQVHIIPIERAGEYSEDQPENFKSFFLQEELRNLNI